MRNEPVTAIAGGMLAVLLGLIAPASADQAADVRKAVDAAMKPLIKEYELPGLAVAVTLDGKRYFASYGVTSKKSQEKVTPDTLFELGSISKTFTATLASLAQTEGKLSLDDRVGKYLPDLEGRAIGNVRLLDLATHTGGGFPLQFPDRVKTDEDAIDYFRDWKPQYVEGAYRTYANPSIGLLGVVTAKAMGDDFKTLMETKLFPQLGLKRTYVEVPASEMKSYAWGHNDDDKQVRVNPGPLDAEAYGVKSNATDMIQFVEVNMDVQAAPDDVAKAVQATHTGHYRAGEIIQDLIWEQYAYPVAVEKIVDGNSRKMAFEPVPAKAITPPMAPRDDVWLNKTGSTGGFGAYVAYIPAKKIGIVMLANRAYSNEARTRAAYAVLSQLSK